MKDLTLVIMAAGMGSRFGGLKQIEPVGPDGEVIANLSVYDAINAGFKKVVFIIRKDNLEYFKQNITKRHENQIEIEFAFQELDMIPSDVKIPETREKMLGTGHAILCAKEHIDGNFVIINGDDYYGEDSYLKAADFFEKSTDEDEYVTVNYPVRATMNPNGPEKRGVVYEENGYVKDTIESEIRFENGKYIAKSLIDNHEFEIEEDTPVSMNFIGFHKKFLSLLEDKFNEFIHGDIDDDIEFLMPEVLKELVEEGKIKGITRMSESECHGITYKEDLDNFISFIMNKGIKRR